MAAPTSRDQVVPDERLQAPRAQPALQAKRPERAACGILKRSAPDRSCTTPATSPAPRSPCAHVLNFSARRACLCLQASRRRVLRQRVGRVRGEVRGGLGPFGRHALDRHRLRSLRPPVVAAVAVVRGGRRAAGGRARGQQESRSPRARVAAPSVAVAAMEPAAARGVAAAWGLLAACDEQILFPKKGY